MPIARARLRYRRSAGVAEPRPRCLGWVSPNLISPTPISHRVGDCTARARQNSEPTETTPGYVCSSALLQRTDFTAWNVVGNTVTEKSSSLTYRLRRNTPASTNRIWNQPAFKLKHSDLWEKAVQREGTFVV